MPSISDLMHKEVVAVSRKASVDSALKLMKESRVSILPVIDEERLAGIISREDAEGKEQMKVGELPLRRLFVELKDKPEKAASIMVQNKINRLPVVNNSLEMRCVGIVTSTEVTGEHRSKIF